jgi:hypothetical protein
LCNRAPPHSFYGVIDQTIETPAVTEELTETPGQYTEVGSSAPDQQHADEDNLSLMDPCVLLPQLEWKSYIASVVNELFPDGTFKFNIHVIPSLIAFLLVVICTIFDILGTHKDTPRERGILAARTLFNIFALPFIMCANVSIIFMRRQDLKKTKRRMIKISMLLILILVCVYFVLLIAFSICVNHGFNPMVLKEVEPLPDDYVPTLISNSTQASFCQLGIGPWNVAEMAGMVAVGQSAGYPKAQEAIFSYINSGNLELQQLPDLSVVPVALAAKYDWYTGEAIGIAFVFQGVTHKSHIGILIENILSYWYIRIMSVIIPLFELMSELFLNYFLSIFSNFFAVAAAGIHTVSAVSISEATQWVGLILNQNQTAITSLWPNHWAFGGHMSGGILAKALGAFYNVTSFSFEAPVLQHSQASFYVNSDANMGAGYRMMNVFSGSTLFSAHEENISMNVRFPNYQSYLKPANPYETLCMMEAGCTNTDRMDQLCATAVGADRYMSYFRRWDRERTPIRLRKGNAD